VVAKDKIAIVIEHNRTDCVCENKSIASFDLCFPYNIKENYMKGETVKLNVSTFRFKNWSPFDWIYYNYIFMFIEFYGILN